MQLRTIFLMGFLVACGGESANTGDGGGPPGTDGGPVDPNCPASVPADGDSCTPPVSCTYESGPHGACSVTASCVSTGPSGPFHWSVSKPGPTCGGNPDVCPSTYASITPGAACNPAATVCDYSEARCECLSCFSDAGSGDEWVCRAWTDVGPGCPTDNPPAAGSACTTAGQMCNYSQLCGISFGPNLECENGKWVVIPSPVGSCILRTCGM